MEECIKSSFMFQTLKKKNQNQKSEAGKAMKKDPPPIALLLRHSHLQGHSMFADFKTFILLKN